MFVWFTGEDTLVHVISGRMIYWRDGRTGALITLFHMRQNLLIANTELINGKLFVAVELGNCLDDDARHASSGRHPRETSYQYYLVLPSATSCYQLLPIATVASQPSYWSTSATSAT